MVDRTRGNAFEDQVREVARALWSISPGDGGAERIDGNEIDCVCRTEDVVHLVECTIDRSQEKVIKQINKLIAAIRAEEKRGNFCRGWIVTLYEPTPDQRTVAKKDRIAVLALSQFRGKLLDATTFLNLRWKHRFGSAADPESGSVVLHEEEYVPLPIVDQQSGRNLGIGDIVAELEKSRCVVLLGDFGAGKSLTVREIFREMRRKTFKEDSRLVPVAVNLREHWGQGEIDEVLHRHSRRIGFPHGDQLVRAWNAGTMVALLDGFDELASQTWRVGPQALPGIRRQAVSVVREFSKESRGRVGILISGRDQFFDTRREMESALGLQGDYLALEIKEFTEPQATAYLRKKGVDRGLPSWLPRKPLLLGYLAARKLLESVVSIEGDRGLAHAWDEFLDRVCQREADIAAEIDAGSVRKILENLANKTRESPDESGPILESDISAAFREVTGGEPSEASMVLLQRLPGLTPRDQEGGVRTFVDREMAEMLRAGSVTRYVENPYVRISQRQWYQPLTEFGCSGVAYLTERRRIAEAKFLVAASEAIDRWSEPNLAMDVLLAAAARNPEETIECGGLRISGGAADVVDLEEVTFRNLILDSCWINVLRLPKTSPENVVLRGCLVGRVDGASEARGLPPWIQDATVQQFDSAGTTSAILALSLALPIRVMLTIIRKTFVQRGKGRLESALRRGLDPSAQAYVDGILSILQSEGVLYCTGSGSGRIWHGSRDHRDRALRLLASPKNLEDQVSRRVSALG